MPQPPVPQSLTAVLERANPAVMATVRPDGAPVSVATWYLWQDDQVLLNLDAGRRRLQHLRENPRVSLTVLDGESWYRHISLQGTVRIVDDPDMSDIDRLARHYTGEQYPVRDRPRVSAWMSVETYHAWGF
ncbi:PPOX class F420-dependent oxidoreductase [Georgenia deserti]|uniref:PPOX class F420-dependent oxidoreductase n=1 Tax=Georgenia deserti TaxID=2093781 RepID=A0ABW4L9I0_9MICO